MKPINTFHNKFTSSSLFTSQSSQNEMVTFIDPIAEKPVTDNPGAQIWCEIFPEWSMVQTLWLLLKKEKKKKSRIVYLTSEQGHYFRCNNTFGAVIVYTWLWYNSRMQGPPLDTDWWKLTRWKITNNLLMAPDSAKLSILIPLALSAALSTISHPNLLS